MPKSSQSDKQYQISSSLAKLLPNLLPSAVP